MKTGTKIAWIYTFLIMTLVAIVGCMFYWLTMRSVNLLYQDYLTERAYTTAEKYWEEDELDAESYAEVKKRYEHSLVPSKEIVLNADSIEKAKITLAKYFNDNQIADLYKGEIVYFSNNLANWQGVALYYPDNEGNFIILVLSNNRYGMDVLFRMKWLLLIALGITAILVYGVGKLYACRLVNRIDEAYLREKAFISNASHEINNPLTAIQGECEISLMKERNTDEYKSALLRISAETQRIVNLMKHLLFLAQKERELQKYAVEPMHLDQFLQGFVTPSIEYKNLGEDAVIEANPHLLKIAICNILNNACKYSRGKKVVMELRGKQVIIKDEGIGISQEDISRIFQPFYRGKNARGFEGNGVGLTLSIQILKAYNAKIHISSTLNKGTQVVIQF